jgi:hypothetical protein
MYTWNEISISTFIYIGLNCRLLTYLADNCMRTMSCLVKWIVASISLYQLCSHYVDGDDKNEIKITLIVMCVDFDIGRVLFVCHILMCSYIEILMQCVHVIYWCVWIAAIYCLIVECWVDMNMCWYVGIDANWLSSVDVLLRLWWDVNMVMCSYVHMFILFCWYVCWYVVLYC